MNDINMNLQFKKASKGDYPPFDKTLLVLFKVNGSDDMATVTGKLSNIHPECLTFANYNTEHYSMSFKVNYTTTSHDVYYSVLDLSKVTV